MILVWFTGLAALALFTGLAWALAPLEPGVVALQFAFTPSAFAAVVDAWPPEHLAMYRAHLPVDGLLLACYGSFGYLLAKRSAIFARRAPAARVAARWALPLAAAVDATENVLHWWLIEASRPAVPWPYVLSAACSGLKWALLLGYAIAVVGALTRAAGSPVRP